MRRLISVILLAFSGQLMAAGSYAPGYTPDAAPVNLDDTESLKAGAETFANYWKNYTCICENIFNSFETPFDKWKQSLLHNYTYFRRFSSSVDNNMCVFGLCFHVDRTTQDHTFASFLSGVNAAGQFVILTSKLKSTLQKKGS